MSLFKNIIILLTLISFFSCAPTTIEKKKPIEKAAEKVEEIEIVEEKEEEIEKVETIKKPSKPGDKIILTKPIGTGIISTAIKKEKASTEIISHAVDSMKMLNKKAAEIAQKFKPNAVTDITGFGLVGHLIEICNASNVSAEINFNNIELLPGTVKFLEQGIMPGGSKRNLKHAENFTIFNPNLTYNQKLITCDAQHLVVF